MSEPTGPDANPTEALELADQQPLSEETAAPAAPATQAAPAAVSAPAKKSHTRTILEIVGGVAAAFLIVAAGVAGFAVGHASSGRDGGRFEAGHSQGFDGPDASGQFGQGQQLPGQQMPGQQGQGMQGFGQMPGQMPGQGVDPDGDNWTGGGQQTLPQQTQPSPQQG
jgi:hypothetical protein